MAPIIYDLLILAVLALFVWLGWRKGLILSLCGLIVVILALVGANFLADTVAPPVAKAIQPKLAEVIEERITDYAASHYDDLQPATPWDALRDMGGIYAWCADSVEDAITQVSGHWDLSEMCAVAANKVAQQLAHHIIFAVSFVLLFVLLTLILHALDLVAKLPGLHFCNGLGGGIIGLVKGVLVLFVVVGVLRIVSGKLVTPDVVAQTYLFKLFVLNLPA